MDKSSDINKKKKSTNKPKLPIFISDSENDSDFEESQKDDENSNKSYTVKAPMFSSTPIKSIKRPQKRRTTINSFNEAKLHPKLSVIKENRPNSAGNDNVTMMQINKPKCQEKSTQSSNKETNDRNLKLRMEIEFSIDKQEIGDVSIVSPTAINNATNASTIPSVPSTSKEVSPLKDTTENVNNRSLKKVPTTPKTTPAKRKLKLSTPLSSKQSPILEESSSDTSETTESKRKLKFSNTPSKRKSNDLPSSKTSPKRKRDFSLKDEEKKEELNLNDLNSMKVLLNNTLKDDKKMSLLKKDDISVMENFLKLDENYQYFLIKLFLYIPKWYNLVKFCGKIKLENKMSQKNIFEMYDTLREENFIDVDAKVMSTDELFNLVSLQDLKDICTKFKMGKQKCRNKETLISLLKKNCRTQSTLCFTASTEDILRQCIFERLGYLIILKDNVRAVLYKSYLLQVFTNGKYITDPYEYLRDTHVNNNVYPDYDVELYVPFSKQEEFQCYFEAVLLKKEFIEAADKKNNILMESCCDSALLQLMNIKPEGKWPRYAPDYLQKFSAEYLYISILKSAIKKLIRIHEKVKLWLEFLIKNYSSHYAIGFWYKQLAHVHVHYLKDYESAAKILIRAFKLKDNFDLVHLTELSILANRVRTIKTYRVCTLYRDELTKCSEMSLDRDLPKKTITGNTYRNLFKKSKRRDYSFLDENNEKVIGKVEMLVINHYQQEENWEGIHCEGRLISVLYNLFFWDIIYNYYVPNTFISNIQSAPLDMYSDAFYKNRKDEIDKIIDSIYTLTDEELKKILHNNFMMHEHEQTLVNLKSVTSDFQELFDMFKSIDRKILGEIFKRLAINFKRFSSGFPDLFLWNSERNECKFVEVKGEGDKLSLTQTLWIQYLMDIGANVEVCHVSGVGAKKTKITENDEIEDEEND